MDDERLLSEALRAHAAGGVSTPRAVPPSDTPPAAPADGPTTRSRRFRPLGRRRTEAAAPAATGAAPTPRADVPSPRTGGVAPPPGVPGAPGARPAPPRPGQPYGGPRPNPPSGPVAAHGPYPSAPPVPPRTAVPTDGPGTWNASTVAWWGVVSLLAGGTVGAAIGVLSLLLPA